MRPIILSIALISSFFSIAADSTSHFKDLLPYSGKIKQIEPRDKWRNLEIPAAYIDQGAWHGFHLPSDKAEYGSFPGPLIIAQEYSVYFSNNIQQLQLLDGTGKPRELASAEYQQQYSQPDGLYQEYRWPDLTLKLALNFIDNRTAAITTSLSNHSEDSQQWQIHWSGKPFSAHPKVKDYQLIQSHQIHGHTSRWSLTPVSNTWNLLLDDAEYQIQFPKKTQIHKKSEGSYSAVLMVEFKTQSATTIF